MTSPDNMNMRGGARPRRRPPANPDHHIYPNNGTFWLAVTVYPTPVTKERKRRSLHTKDRLEARRRRDAELLKLASTPGLQLACPLPAHSSAPAGPPPPAPRSWPAHQVAPRHSRSRRRKGSTP